MGVESQHLGVGASRHPHYPESFSLGMAPVPYFRGRTLRSLPPAEVHEDSTEVA